jgi:hypothetical protein
MMMHLRKIFALSAGTMIFHKTRPAFDNVVSELAPANHFVLNNSFAGAGIQVNHCYKLQGQAVALNARALPLNGVGVVVQGGGIAPLFDPAANLGTIGK